MMLGLLGCLSGLAGGRFAQAADFSEPPQVLFGKVFSIGVGGSHQIFNGTLQITLVDRANATNVVVRQTSLHACGLSGEYSYRLELPMQVSPTTREKNLNLAVGSNYRLAGVAVDGQVATPVDPNQALQLDASYLSRAREMRFDFKAAVAQTDTDGDGMPDWWETQNGLNPLSAADAGLDNDHDGLTNLQEFLLGTDPNTANTIPVLQENTLLVPAGGLAGFSLSIVAPSSSPEKLMLSLGDGAGLNFYSSGASLSAGTEFSYRSVLSGHITIKVPLDFKSVTLPLRIRDLLQSTNSRAVETFLQISAFSPSLQTIAIPALWLDAASLRPAAGIGAVPALVADWTDRSAAGRDAYQPYAGSEPLADGTQVRFSSGQFLYVDDRDLNLSECTALISFQPGAGGGTSQTLFNSSDLELSLEGTIAGGRSLWLKQSGRLSSSPAFRSGQIGQITLNSGSDHSLLQLPDMGMFLSYSNGMAHGSSFTTLGGQQPVSSAVASNFFDGILREVIFYDRPISSTSRARLQDYQLSRWEGFTVWDFRNAMLSVAITGHAGVRNSISGGVGDDFISGNDQADILRGGAGHNRLTGGAGADRFQFEPNNSQDVITDFSLSDGDVIDLNDVFAEQSGLPSRFVTIRSVVTRGTNNLPRVDSILELCYDGQGKTVDQTVKLEGVKLGNSDLPRLVGSGVLQLGGLHYDPAILSAPESQVVVRGHSVAFSVAATSSTTLGYQWCLNRIPIAGATSSSYFRNNVQAVDTGSYSVVVSCASGSITSSPALLSIGQAPAIKLQPQTQWVAFGAPATLDVSVSGTAPFDYQWRKVSGRSPGSSLTQAWPHQSVSALTLYAATNADSGNYLVIITNSFGSVTSQVSVLSVGEYVRPTLAILSPTPNQFWSNAFFTVTGRSADNKSVAAVRYQLNGSGWSDAITTNGWANWSAPIPLQSGTNVVQAYARDSSGNMSVTSRVLFAYFPSDRLLLQIAGQGTVSPNATNALLQVGRIYTLTAKPAAGYVFSNWLGGVSAPVGNLTSDASLTFTMVSNLVLQANFVPNPFAAVAGNYQGLFFDPADPAQATAGFFNATVNDHGGFTARLQSGTNKPSISGQFPLNGSWSTNRLYVAGPAVAARFQLDLNGGDRITGVISNGVVPAQLLAPRGVFSAGHPAPQVGKYTLVIAGSADAANEPGGHGYGAVTVNANGSVTFAGRLGDTTNASQGTILSKAGLWPFYAPLYGDRGSIFGWLSFTNASDRDIAGVLNWTKPAQPGALSYPFGFTLTGSDAVEAVGSHFTPTNGVRLLAITNGMMILDNGNLPESSTNAFVLGANNIAIGPNSLRLTLTNSTGIFSGSVNNPAAGSVLKVSGAVLQKQNAGFGQFPGTNQTGSVFLVPQ